MSIELSRRVKDLEAALAEINRQIAELVANKADVAPVNLAPGGLLTVTGEVKRKPGRPRKNGGQLQSCEGDRSL